MGAVLSKIIVVLLLIIVILIVLKVMGIINPRPKVGGSGIIPAVGPDPDATMSMPEWKIELINDENGEVLKEKIIWGLSGNDRFTIGRKDCDFIIPSEFVSRSNAVIVKEIVKGRNKYVLRASKNAASIYYHGKKIEQIELKNGIVLKFAQAIPVRFKEISAADLINGNMVDQCKTESVDIENELEDTFIDEDVINPRF